ncbi:MAG: type II secretion system minor pseudopilin GspK [Deltaproteobacteria bacterium]|nr:type II secretion system minor pseudopilin GspK [Deltaproteobacteria bacterium]
MAQLIKKTIEMLLPISKKKEGIALLIVLVIVALLVAVVVEFNRIAIADIDTSKNFGDSQKILYIGISGVHAIQEILYLEGVYTPSDNLQEEWANSETYFKAATALMDEGEVKGSISDEESRININALVGGDGNFNPEQLAIWKRLLSNPRFSLSEEDIDIIIYGIKDWIDADDEVSGIYGAEEAFYQGMGYHCKNGPMNGVEEMLLVKGITPEIFYGNRHRDGIGQYFTVYGKGRININTAPIPVLMALSDQMSEDIALEMDNFRHDPVNRADLANKLWYKKVWPFEKSLPDDLLTISSRFFSVRIHVSLGESRKEIAAIVSRSENGSRILLWREL